MTLRVTDDPICDGCLNTLHPDWRTNPPQALQPRELQPHAHQSGKSVATKYKLRIVGSTKWRAYAASRAKKDKPAEPRVWDTVKNIEHRYIAGQWSACRDFQCGAPKAPDEAAAFEDPGQPCKASHSFETADGRFYYIRRAIRCQKCLKLVGYEML